MSENRASKNHQFIFSKKVKLKNIKCWLFVGFFLPLTDQIDILQMFTLSVGLGLFWFVVFYLSFG